MGMKKTSSGFAHPGVDHIKNSKAQNNGKQHKRPWCQYGEKCYRKNPVHFKEFRHPHLDKHDSDSEEE